MESAFSAATGRGLGYAAPVSSTPAAPTPAPPAAPLPASPAALAAAYAACHRVAAGHAENFPVASRLLPAALRPHLAAFYAFARLADDLADEPGHGDVAARRAALGALRARLAAPVPAPGPDGRWSGDDATFAALGATRAALGLDTTLFARLLDAFERDLVQPAYDTWEDLLSYCRDSAEPVGRLVLAAAGDRDPENAERSDLLCTALQLANHWQDLSRDEPAGRRYLPQAERSRWGDDRALAFAIARTARMFDDAAPLVGRAPASLGPWLAAVLAGGRAILEKSRALGPRAFHVRPRLGAGDRVRLLVRAARARARGGPDGSSFAPAFLLLPPERREPLAALHALCRALDDDVDEAPDADVARAAADAARAEVATLAAGRPRTLAARRLAQAWRGLDAPLDGLLREGLDALVDGLAADAIAQPIASDDDLELYCRRVGGGPGLAALPVFGRPDARDFALALGVALQRTNVLRDVAADARVGRLYVPAADLAPTGLTLDDLAAARMPPAFRPVARALARRARAAFAAARAAVPPGAERALAPALGMGRVYAAVLARLEADPPRAWTTRVRLPKLEAALRGLGLLGGGR